MGPRSGWDAQNCRTGQSTVPSFYRGARSLRQESGEPETSLLAKLGPGLRSLHSWSTEACGIFNHQQKSPVQAHALPSHSPQLAGFPPYSCHFLAMPLATPLVSSPLHALSLVHMALKSLLLSPGCFLCTPSSSSTSLERLVGWGRGLGGVQEEGCKKRSAGGGGVWEEAEWR